MDLVELQDEAWLRAEAKGLHADLDQDPTSDRRTVALASLACVFASVSTLAQFVKRHGVSESLTAETIMVNTAKQVLDLFLEDCAAGQTALVGPKALPLAARLALIQTEFAEALAALTQGEERDVIDREAFVRELADSVIRTADVVEIVGGHL